MGTALRQAVRDTRNLPGSNIGWMTDTAPVQPAPTQTYRLWQKATRLPFGSRLFSAAVSLKAPYFRTVLPHVVDVRPGRCEVRGPGWWGNRNHIGTFHVIAALNLAEMAMGVLAEATVPATHRWIPVGMNVRYPAMSTGGLTVTAEWTEIPDFSAITSGQDIDVPLRFVDDAGVEPVVGSITIRVSPKTKR